MPGTVKKRSTLNHLISLYNILQYMKYTEVLLNSEQPSDCSRVGMFLGLIVRRISPVQRNDEYCRRH